MTLQNAREQRHTLFVRAVDAHTAVEVVDVLAAEAAPSGQRETILSVPLAETRGGIPSWVLGVIDEYGLQLAPEVETDGGRVRLVVW